MSSMSYQSGVTFRVEAWRVDGYA